MVNSLGFLSVLRGLLQFGCNGGLVNYSRMSSEPVNGCSEIVLKFVSDGTHCTSCEHKTSAGIIVLYCEDVSQTAFRLEY